MNFLLPITLIITTFFVSFYSSARNSTEYSTEYLTVKDGVPMPTVHKIFEDSYGFIWIGTQGGLFRYDGIEYKHYPFGEGYGTVPATIIYSITQKNDDCLLLGTHNNGLVEFRYSTGLFKRISIGRVESIRNINLIQDIEVDVNENIWLALHEGILVLDKDYMHASTFLNTEIAGVDYAGDVFDLHESVWGQMYASVRNIGVFQVSLQEKNIQRLYPKTIENDGLYFTIESQGNNQLYITTGHSGIIQLTKNGDDIRVVSDTPISTEYISIATCDKTLYWGGINGGLYYKNANDLSSTKVDLQPAESIKNKNISVTDIIKDRFGNIWIGTGIHGYGLIKLQANTPFKKYIHGVKSNLLENEIVQCIHETNQYVLCGTDGSGLFVYDKTNSRYSHFTEKGGLSSNVILSIEQSVSNKSEFWLGTWGGGLSRLNIKTKKVKNFLSNDKNPNSITFQNIKDIVTIEDTLWVMTHGDGINVYDPKSNTFISDNYLYDLKLPRYGNQILKDSYGDIWIATTVGLYRYSNGKSISYFETISSTNVDYGSNITALFEDKAKRLWIGTTFGLEYFDEERDSLHLIPLNVIPHGVKSIQPISDSVLYIATQNSIYKLNTNDYSTEIFTSEEGLSGVFNERAVFSVDSTIYWGTTNGVVYSNSSLSNYLPQEFYIIVDNIQISDIDNTSNKQWHYITSDTSVFIAHTHTRINLSFSVLGHQFPKKLTYRYKLEGIDPDYTTTTHREINYSKLPAGEYTLHIKAKANNAISERTLLLIVEPSLIERLWFQLLLVFICMAVIAGIFILRVRKIREHEQLLEAKVERRTQKLQQQNDELEAQRAELSDAYKELNDKGEALSLSNEQLQSLNKTQSKLMAILAHDLKNNFGSIIGFAQMLSKNKEKLNEYLPFIINGVTNTNGILQNLLSWSQSQSGELKFSEETFDLKDVISRVVEQNLVYASEKEVQLKNLVTDSIFIKADQITVLVVIRNIIQNALKFSNQNSEVIIDVELKTDSVSIIIKDYGTGMSEDQIDAILNTDSYQFTEGTAGEKGSGLGLVVSKDFVKRNNGTLNIISAKGSGSSFILDLPLADTHTVTKEETTEAIKEQLEVAMYDATILIVEDNPDLRKQIVALFENRYSILEAKNGVDALKIVRQQKPDLIISDLMMPKMHGDALCKEIKEDIRLSHIPVVLLTAMPSAENRQKCFATGAEAFLEKPFDLTELLTVASNIIQTRVNFKRSLSIDEKTAIEDIQETEEELFFNKVAEVIEKHYTNPNFGVEMLAEELALNRSHLYRKLKASGNHSPIDLISTFRFNKAKKLLLTKRYNVAEVGYMCGFNVPKYFSRRFKEYYGETPTEFVKRHDSASKD